MIKQIFEIFLDFWGILGSSAILAGLLYVALVLCAGLSLTYGQIFGVFFAAKLVRNWLR